MIVADVAVFNFVDSKTLWLPRMKSAEKAGGGLYCVPAHRLAAVQSVVVGVS